MRRPSGLAIVVTGSDGEQIGSRFSALDRATQFDNAQGVIRAVIGRRRTLVPTMLP